MWEQLRWFKSDELVSQEDEKLTGYTIFALVTREEKENICHEITKLGPQSMA